MPHAPRPADNPIWLLGLSLLAVVVHQGGIAAAEPFALVPNSRAEPDWEGTTAGIPNEAHAQLERSLAAIRIRPTPEKEALEDLGSLAQYLAKRNRTGRQRLALTRTYNQASKKMLKEIQKWADEQIRLPQPFVRAEDVKVGMVGSLDGAVIKGIASPTDVLVEIEHPKLPEDRRAPGPTRVVVRVGDTSKLRVNTPLEDDRPFLVNGLVSGSDSVGNVRRYPFLEPYPTWDKVAEHVDAFVEAAKAAEDR